MNTYEIEGKRYNATNEYKAVKEAYKLANVWNMLSYDENEDSWIYEAVFHSGKAEVKVRRIREGKNKKHTPVPYEIASPTMAGNERIIIEAYGFGSIAVVSLNGAPKAQSRLNADSPYYAKQIPTMEANAEFIVKACNCHYELLKACQTALKDCEMVLSGEWDKSDEGFEATREMLQAAINKVAEA